MHRIFAVWIGEDHCGDYHKAIDCGCCTKGVKCDFFFLFVLSVLPFKLTQKAQSSE